MSIYKILIVVITFNVIYCDTDYCTLETELCKGKPHIGCEKSKTGLPEIVISEECNNKLMIPIDYSLKKLLIKEHNHWRNLLAQGAIQGFPSATKMMKMQWNDELEDLAYIHANYCTFEHDQCRATEKYNKSGQNIALKFYSHPRESKHYETMIREMCAEWFEEYKLISKDKIQDIINQYEHEEKWGHFAVMAREKNEALGCALVSMENVKLKKELPYHYMLTCNYADTIFIKEILYDHGEACSQCNKYGSTFDCDKAEYHRLCYNITDEKNENIIIDTDDERFGKCHGISSTIAISSPNILIVVTTICLPLIQGVSTISK